MKGPTPPKSNEPRRGERTPAKSFERTSMQRQQDIARLRDILAGLYPDLQQARRILHDAGLSERAIDLSGSPIDRWHRLLIEVERQGRVSAVVDVATHDYPSNAELGEIGQRVIAARLQDRPGADLRESQPPTPLAAGVPRWWRSPRIRLGAVGLLIVLSTACVIWFVRQRAEALLRQARSVSEREAPVSQEIHRIWLARQRARALVRQAKRVSEREVPFNDELRGDRDSVYELYHNRRWGGSEYERLELLNSLVFLFLVDSSVGAYQRQRTFELSREACPIREPSHGSPLFCESMRSCDLMGQVLLAGVVAGVERLSDPPLLERTAASIGVSVGWERDSDRCRWRSHMQAIRIELLAHTAQPRMAPERNDWDSRPLLAAIDILAQVDGPSDQGTEAVDVTLTAARVSIARHIRLLELTGAQANRVTASADEICAWATPLADRQLPVEIQWRCGRLAAERFWVDLPVSLTRDSFCSLDTRRALRVSCESALRPFDHLVDPGDLFNSSPDVPRAYSKLCSLLSGAPTVMSAADWVRQELQDFPTRKADWDMYLLFRFVDREVLPRLRRCPSSS